MEIPAQATSAADKGKRVRLTSTACAGSAAARSRMSMTRRDHRAQNQMRCIAIGMSYRY
jgi:hypothetical protein